MIDEPICMYCTWFTRDRGLVCGAYPDGIPQEIIESEVDHRAPYQGDRGRRFEARDPRGARIASELIKSARTAAPAEDQGSEGLLVT